MRFNTQKDRLIRRLVVAAGTVLLIVAAYPTPASADGPNPQPPREELSAQNQQLEAIKAQVAVDYAAHKRAGGSIDEFAPQFAALGLALNGGQPLVNTAPRSSAAATAPDSASSTYPSNYLFPAWQYQIEDWYCGPAAAWVAWAWLGAPNNYLGIAMTQENMAPWAWLQTDTYGATPLGENWRKTLNAWVDGTNDGFYILKWAPTPTQVANNTALDIDMNYVPILDIEMSTTNGYLHSGYTAYGTVQHYVAGSGYSDYGNTVNYIDPWGVVQPGERENSASLFSSLMRNHGMVY